MTITSDVEALRCDFNGGNRITAPTKTLTDPSGTASVQNATETLATEIPQKPVASHPTSPKFYVRDANEANAQATLNPMESTLMVPSIENNILADTTVSIKILIL